MAFEDFKVAKSKVADNDNKVTERRRGNMETGYDGAVRVCMALLDMGNKSGPCGFRYHRGAGYQTKW